MYISSGFSPGSVVEACIDYIVIVHSAVSLLSHVIVGNKSLTSTYGLEETCRDVFAL